MQGVILAAGQGTRMGNLEIPKCLLKIDDITLIEYQLTCLKKLGIDDILIVTGYNDQMIKHNPVAGNKNGCVCLSITENDVIFFGKFASLLNIFTFIKSFFK